MKEHNVYEGQRDGLFDGPHLSGEGQALAADALALDRMEDLPDGVQEHLGECQECREAVIEVYQILRDTDSLPEEGDHPFFSRGEAVEEPLKPAGRRWLKYAAIALLILLPGSMLILRAP
ncbi:MAG TPA: hypothetical protein P5550_08210, partial [Bacteroidales bacterium]|nr:hypothetical protein [Bacteroidales bacterium]